MAGIQGIQTSLAENRATISRLESERESIKSQYGVNSREFQNWLRGQSAGQLRIAYAAKTRLREELKTSRQQSRGYSGQDPYGRGPQTPGERDMAIRQTGLTTANVPGRTYAGIGTGSGAYQSGYERVGISRSEWASMTPDARAAVEKQASLGKLRRAGEIDRTLPMSLTIVDAQGRPVTEYVATTDYAGGTRTLTQRNVSQFYPDFGTGKGVPRNRYQPSLTPFLTARIENVALGKGLTTPKETVTYGSSGPSWLPEGMQKRGMVVTTTQQTRSGAQSQLAMIGQGKSFAEAYKYGNAPVTLQITRTTLARSERGEQAYQQRSQNAAIIGLRKTGGYIEGVGGGLIDYSQENLLKSENTFKRGYGGVMYGGGQAFEKTGQFVGGTGRFLQEKPVEAIVAFGAGTAFGAGSQALGNWAAVTQKTGPVLASFGLKGIGSFAGGYWGAGEAKAIYESPRPGERAAETAGIALSFSLGLFFHAPCYGH